jgi:transposase
MPKKMYVVLLTADERSYLHGLLSKGRVAAHKQRHARILLKADASEAGDGWTDGRIAEALEIGRATVERVRQRCVEEGLEAALNRKKRSPSPAKVMDGNAEAHLVALACSPPPEGRNRWTMRLLADKMVELEYVESISHNTVWQTLKKTSSNRG